MDLGVTMGISLRFKAAQPYLWRERKGGKIGGEWPKNQGRFKDISGIQLEASRWEPREDALLWQGDAAPLASGSGGGRERVSR